MSESGNVVARLAVVACLVAGSAVLYSAITHGRLTTAEQRVAVLEQERTSLKTRLARSEDAVVMNAAAAKTCGAKTQSSRTLMRPSESGGGGAIGHKANNAVRPLAS